MEEIEKIINSKDKPIQVHDAIKEGSIVWVVESNLNVTCGVVKKIGSKQAEVFVYEGWATWSVHFDDIIRVGTSYYSDKYREMTRGNIRIKGK